MRMGMDRQSRLRRLLTRVVLRLRRLGRVRRLRPRLRQLRPRRRVLPLLRLRLVVRVRRRSRVRLAQSIDQLLILMDHAHFRLNLDVAGAHRAFRGPSTASSATARQTSLRMTYCVCERQPRRTFSQLSFWRMTSLLELSWRRSSWRRFRLAGVGPSCRLCALR